MYNYSYHNKEYFEFSYDEFIFDLNIISYSSKKNILQSRVYITRNYFNTRERKQVACKLLHFLGKFWNWYSNHKKNSKLREEARYFGLRML